MRHRIDPELTRRARDLRNNPTPTEPAVWHRSYRFRPAFTRQFVIAPFIIDLACRQAKLGVEFDGSQHLDQERQDASRTAYLERKGWRIIRFWSSDVLANPDGATQHILSAAAECLGGTHQYQVNQPPAGSDRPGTIDLMLPPSQGGEKKELTIDLGASELPSLSGRGRGWVGERQLASTQSRSNSLMLVLPRVCASTRLTITAQ